MPASPADSALYRGLFGDEDTARLFTDAAEVRAMLLVEGALARVQGALGLIPAEAAAFIDRAAQEVVLDPAAMAQGVARDGVPVPAFLQAFRKAANAPDLMAFVHWGATSQDIIDTAMALRLKRVMEIWDRRLIALVAALGEMAEAHADLPMVARTWGQAATPTSFGVLVASWGRPLLRHRARLAAVREAVMQVSLSGAAGTLAAMGPKGPEVRAGLAAALGLADPGASWHADRDGIVALAGWMAGVTGSLAKIGADVVTLCQTGIGEVVLDGAGGSSTMPHKANPVGPAALVSLARVVAGLDGVVQGAAVHGMQRDGAAWMAEWLTLPQMCVLTGRALVLAAEVATQLRPDAQAMARGMAADGGLIHAEALTFALATRMPRPAAAEAVKALVAEVRAVGGDLLALARAKWPDLPVETGPGQAPTEARAFAAAARALT